MAMKAHKLFIILISIFFVLNLLYFFNYNYGDTDDSGESVKSMKIGGKKLELLKGHPVIVILTSNKPKHLDRLLSTLVQIEELDRKRVLVFSDGLESVDPILEKYNITGNKNGLKSRLNLTAHGVAVSDSEKFKFTNQMYREAMSSVFKRHTTAIILEDDLIPSLDFLYYFSKLEPLLWLDGKLFCISAWNDNAFKWAGYPTHKSWPQNMFSVNRQSHFGGLGWMVSHTTYFKKIEPAWGDLNTPWDVFVQNSMRPGDYCLFPEIPRVQHAPNSTKKLYDAYKGTPEDDGWAYMQLSPPKVRWGDYRHLDFKHLVNDAGYDGRMDIALKRSIKIDTIDILPFFNQSTSTGTAPALFSILIEDVAFDNDPAWEKHLTPLGLTGRGNGGNIRGIYKGVVSVIIHGWQVLFVGRYSIFSQTVSELSMDKSESIMANLPHYDQSIEAVRSKANIFKVLGNKQSILPIHSQPGQNCREACSSQNKDKQQKQKQKQSKKGKKNKSSPSSPLAYCHESDQLLLLDKMATLYIYETKCDRVEIARGIDIPVRYDNFTCQIPAEPSRLSCNQTPPRSEPPGASVLCLCRQQHQPQ